MRYRRNKSSAILSILLVLSVSASFSIRSAAFMPVYRCNNTEKAIALTFDDGPHPKYTPRILDILDKYDIKATFFFIGQNIVYYRDTAKMVYERGHEIGNHTYDHTIISKCSPEKVEEEISENDRMITSINGIGSSLFRPPQGSYRKSDLDIINKLGYRTVLWSLDTEDWKHTSPERIYRYVTGNIKDGDIILFHDYISGENTTIPALEILIPELLREGYRFVTVSELIARSG